MLSPRSFNRLVSVLLYCGVALLTSSCADAPEHDTFGGDLEAAERALRELGSSTFDVISFNVGAGDYVEARYGPRFSSYLYVVSFTAEIRFVRTIDVPEMPAMIESYRESQPQPSRIERDVSLLGFVGAGKHDAASTQSVQGAAVFENVESGWRFSIIDPRPDLRRLIEESRM